MKYRRKANNKPYCDILWTNYHWQKQNLYKCSHISKKHKINFSLILEWNLHNECYYIITTSWRLEESRPKGPELNVLEIWEKRKCERRICECNNVKITIVDMRKKTLSSSPFYEYMHRNTFLIYIGFMKIFPYSLVKHQSHINLSTKLFSVCKVKISSHKDTCV